jgi:hypothetical protein
MWFFKFLYCSISSRNTIFQSEQKETFIIFKLEREQHQIRWDIPYNVLWYQLMSDKSSYRAKFLIVSLIWGRWGIKNDVNNVIFVQFLWRNSFMTCFLFCDVFWHFCFLDILDFPFIFYIFDLIWEIFVLNWETIASLSFSL